MAQKISQVDLREQIVRAKDHDDRRFQMFTNNFYIMKAALRYFSVKQGMSFTSSKIADKFPLTVPVAGSGLKVLEDLDVVEKRNNSSSPDRYMPQKVDLEKLQKIEDVLVESYEINDFCENDL